MVLVFFGPALLTGRILPLDDLLYLFYPGYVYFREHVLQGELPLWNPHTGCGEPFMADVERGVFYPPHLIYLFIPTSVGIVLLPALHILLAGAGTYALSRVWGVSRTGSLLAGVLYAFNSYTISKVGFASEVDSAAWFPAVMATFALWVKRPSRRRLFLMSGALCLQFLAGFPEVVTFTVGALLLYAAFVGIYDWRMRRTYRALLVPVLGLGAAGVLAVLLSAVQFLPAWEAMHLSPRSEEVAPRLYEYSLHPLAVFTLLVPSVYGVGGSPGNFWAPSCGDQAIGAFYVGVVPIAVFAAAAVCRLLRPMARRNETAGPDNAARVRVPYLLALFVCFYLYALGHYTPVCGFLRDLVPLLQRFVSPPKCLLCVVLSLSCLAGIGVDYVARTGAGETETGRGWRSVLLRWGAPCVFVAVGVFIVACLLNGGQLGKAVLVRFFNLGSVEPRFAHNIPWGTLIRDAVRLPIVGFAGVLLLQRYAFRLRGGVVAAWLMIGLSFGDLWLTNAHILEPGPASALEHPSPLLEKLKPEGKMIRFFGMGHVTREEVHRMAASLPTTGKTEVLADSRAADDDEGDEGRLDSLLRDLSYKSWPIVDKTFNVHSTHNFVSNDVVRIYSTLLWTKLPGITKTRLLAMLNCDRIVLPPDPMKRFETGRQGATRLVLLDEPLPRAYVVGGIRLMDGQEATFRGLLSPAFDPLSEALMDQTDTSRDTFSDLRPGRIRHTVKRVEYGPNRLEIDVESASAGMLVVSDAHFPGWYATVNGKQAPIHKVNAAFRGIRVEAGTSAVRMTYWPRSLSAGIAISLATLVVLCILSLPKPRAQPESGNRQQIPGDAG